MKITPSFLVSFETEITGIVENTWQRVASNLNWDRFMKLRPASTRTQILVWLLTTAKLYPEGQGGNTRFDDLIAATTSYSVQNVGAGLKLTRNEIEDNQIDAGRLGTDTTVGAMDYAGKWANDIGFAAAYWPQQMFMNLLLNGESGIGYDGVPFFSASHPLNPVAGASQGTYSNLLTGVGINPAAQGGDTTLLSAIALAQTNLASALSSVAKQKFIGGIPRYIVPKFLLVPTALQYRAMQLTGGDMLGQNTNVLKGYNLEVVVDPNLDTDPTSYYIVAADAMSDDMGPFIYSERKPFELNTYSPVEQETLGRMDEFEWLMKGRNTAVYGHPYLITKCKV